MRRESSQRRLKLRWVRRASAAGGVLSRGLLPIDRLPGSRHANTQPTAMRYLRLYR